jgi:hypothetical protein
LAVAVNERSDIRPNEVMSEQVDGVIKEEALGELEAEELQQGERKAAKLNDPREPTSAERASHEMAHLPFRSWCRHCVRGRGKNAAHYKQAQGEGELHELHFDFAFMGEEDEPGETIAMLVVRERQSRMTLATAVPSKSTGKFVVDRVMAFMKEIGIENLDVIAKSDQEPAIKHLIDEIGKAKAEFGGRWVVVSSPVDSHASNGVVERAIQSVEGQVRVLRSCLEEKWGVKLSSKHAVIPWIMEHAAYVLNRFEVGHDGRTAYERCKGKQARAPGVQFGEGVLWRRKPIGNALGKLTLLWEDGIFLGVKGRTGEYIIGDQEGVWKTRTLQRRPESERWKSMNAEYVTGVPWNVSADDPNVDGEQMEIIKANPGDLEREAKPKDDSDITIPRRWKISKQDLLTHGFSARCEGCKALLAKRPARNHSEDCRKRLRDALGDDPRFREADRRIDEFFENVGRREELREEEEALPEASLPRGSGIDEEDRKMSLRETREEEAKRARREEERVEKRKVTDTPDAGESDHKRPARRDGRVEIPHASGEEAARHSVADRSEVDVRVVRYEASSCFQAPMPDQIPGAGHHPRVPLSDQIPGAGRHLQVPISDQTAASSAGSGADRFSRAPDPDQRRKADAGPSVVCVSATYETNDEEDENEWDDGEYIDQKTGEYLDPELARRARLEEIQFMKKIGLFEEVPIEQCWEMTGKDPISTKWVDIDKGTLGSPDVRCRLVARDFKPRGERDREDLFAAMPPLEAKKLIFQKAVTENARSRAEGGDGVKLMSLTSRKRTSTASSAMTNAPSSSCRTRRRVAANAGAFGGGCTA